MFRGGYASHLIKETCELGKDQRLVPTWGKFQEANQLIDLSRRPGAQIIIGLIIVFASDRCLGEIRDGWWLDQVTQPDVPTVLRKG